MKRSHATWRWTSWSTPALTDLVDDDVAAAHPSEQHRSGETQQEVVHATTQSPTMDGHNHSRNHVAKSRITVHLIVIALQTSFPLKKLMT